MDLRLEWSGLFVSGNNPQKSPTLEMKVLEVGHYPFGKKRITNRDSTRRSDSWVPHTNSGMESICFFYLFGKVRLMSQTKCVEHTQA